MSEHQNLPAASFSNMHGFTLIELVIVILLLGVLGSIATIKMNQSIETARYEQTKNELDHLTFAIVGNPEAFTDGARADFGYVGDIGALPTNLDALVQNPGGWSTWNGPYIEAGPSADDFKKDAWNVFYIYSDTLIRSTGSGSSIDKLFASSSSTLLANTVSGWVVDADRQIPPGSFNDSVTVLLTYPDGSGGMSGASTTLSQRGGFSYTGVPIGNHSLRVIYGPDSDTITYAVAVYPGRDVKLDIIFPADLW
jgi:prepilin-type N-terminal cleavage/methylation domain-containing protein